MYNYLLLNFQNLILLYIQLLEIYLQILLKIFLMKKFLNQKYYIYYHNFYASKELYKYLHQVQQIQYLLILVHFYYQLIINLQNHHKISIFLYLLDDLNQNKNKVYLILLIQQVHFQKNIHYIMAYKLLLDHKLFLLQNQQLNLLNYILEMDKFLFLLYLQIYCKILYIIFQNIL